MASLLTHLVILPIALPRLLIPAPPPEIEVTYLPDVVSADDKNLPESESLVEEKPEPLKPEELPPEPDRRLAKPEEKKKPDPKPLEVVPMPNLPMVDQEQFPDEADNDKAHFLAQKNHRAAEDMQTKERTLDKPPPADSPESPPGEPNPAPAPVAPEQKIAKSVDSPLRMREPGAEFSEPNVQAPGGDQNPWVVAKPPKPGSMAGSQDLLPIAPQRLTPTDYDKLVGTGVAEAERRSAALNDHTGQPGYWDHLMRKQDALRASLENFVGNVKIGNQSELGTRKHPFAGFITAMHRQIHRYWGDGFLADLDKKSKDVYPMSLVSAIEICVEPDGKVNPPIIVKHSGSLPFDTAALDAVMSAAPYPAPPEAIKSRDGKVYLTWYFHRDDRQCHPHYVDMHILTTPPPPSKKPPSPAPPALKLLPGGELLPRFAARSDGAAFAPGASLPGGTATVAASSSEKPPAAAPIKPTVPDAARDAAERWLTAYKKSDARWLAGASGLPFTAGGKQVADSGEELRKFFTEMIAEGVPAQKKVTYYTQNQIRGKIGHLPRGADDDDMVFAYVELAGEELILLLAPSDRGFSVVGLDR